MYKKEGENQPAVDAYIMKNIVVDAFISNICHLKGIYDLSFKDFVND